MKALTDTDPMPFGKHCGHPMQDIPADYLCYLWNAYEKKDRDETAVGQYIQRSMKALRQENPDLIFK